MGCELTNKLTLINHALCVPYHIHHQKAFRATCIFVCLLVTVFPLLNHHYMLYKYIVVVEPAGIKLLLSVSHSYLMFLTMTLFIKGGIKLYFQLALQV